MMANPNVTTENEATADVTTEVLTTDLTSISFEHYYSVEELQEFTAAGLSCIAVPDVPALSICFALAGGGLDISAKFGPITLDKIHLSKDGVCEQIGGSKLGFTLQLKVCFLLKPKRHFTIQGKACAPVVGCKSVNRSFNI